MYDFMTIKMMMLCPTCALDKQLLILNYIGATWWLDGKGSACYVNIKGSF